MHIAGKLEEKTTYSFANGKTPLRRKNIRPDTRASPALAEFIWGTRKDKNNDYDRRPFSRENSQHARDEWSAKRKFFFSLPRDLHAGLACRDVRAGLTCKNKRCSSKGTALMAGGAGYLHTNGVRRNGSLTDKGGRAGIGHEQRTSPQHEIRGRMFMKKFSGPCRGLACKATKKRVLYGIPKMGYVHKHSA